MNASNPIKAVLFDLDGTLLDSAPQLNRALNVVRQQHQLPPLPLEKTRAQSSKGARGMLALGMDLESTDDPRYEPMKNRFLEVYEQVCCENTVLFEGAEALLAWLQQQGCHWGIVTNKSRRFAPQVLRSCGLDHAQVLVCGDDIPRPKPDPTGLLQAAARLAVSPSQAIYVGDSRRDVWAGQQAGMGTVALSGGYLAPDEGAVESWGAQLVRESLVQLLQHWQRRGF